MNKRIWLIFGGVAVTVLVAWLAVWRLSSGVIVDTATAEIGTIREFVDERAKTRLPQTYLITMP
jgi:hypothetical protein